MLLGGILFLSLVEVQAQPRVKKKKHQKESYEEVEMDTMDIYPVNKILDYKGAYSKYFHLIHTKLELEPSFQTKKIEGVATLKVSPVFYDQVELVLDAKGMTFDTITYSLDAFKTPLKYRYDGLRLSIELPQKVSRKDTFEVRIPYTANTHELNDVQKSLGQGGFFINAHQTNPYRKTIFWTQGETEAASCWFPTFDATNQKTTQDIFVTVPDSLVTISNGSLREQIVLGNGKRKDHWQQNQAHAPYLFALVIGPYFKYADQWRDKPVEYYALEPYHKDVYQVYKNTPDMMEYFSKIFGYDYPWDNYKQVTVYDFTAGAMENTTLSIFNENLMCQHPDIDDRHHGEDLIIAHELVHQWFGDLVTCESWSQLTLNESFANYGEFLWLEKWKGLADAEAHYFNRFNAYKNEFTYKKVEPIVQHYYKSPDEVFDRHRYDKGGLVLNMLRKYLGDEAFFEGLKVYLTTKAYQTAEIHDLRMAFEQVTGRDLNWFFDQWWLNPGHPQVEVKKSYDAEHKEVVLEFLQKQDQHPNATIPLHRIFVDVDLIYADTVITHTVEFTNKKEIKRIFSETAPLAINIDPGKLFVWNLEETIQEEELPIIYQNSHRVLDKENVIRQLKEKNIFSSNGSFLLEDFEEQHWFIKEKIMNNALAFDEHQRKVLLPKVLNLVLSPKATERSHALFTLQKMKYEDLSSLVQSQLSSDTSNLVKSTCLRILTDSLKKDAREFIDPYIEKQNAHLVGAVGRYLGQYGEGSDVHFFERSLLTLHHYYVGDTYKSLGYLLERSDVEVIERAISLLENIIENEYPNNRVKLANKYLPTFKDLLSNKKGY